MIKVLKILLTVLVTSFFFFPVGLLFLAGINSKNLLAAIGLVFIIIELVKQRESSIPRELLVLLLLSSMVSIMSLVSVTYNETPDLTYASFIRSTIIWLSAAFSVISIIRLVHGRIDVPLVVHYLIGACLFQCVTAMLIAFVPSFSAFVDRYFDTGQRLMREVERLYGIGALLDVAGSRFSTVLVAIAFLFTSSPKKIKNGLVVFYTLSFIVISVIGNMIARTTTIGMLIGIAWVILAPFVVLKPIGQERPRGKGFVVLITTSVLILVSVTLYNTVPQVKEFLRFGFEGFFSLAERGEWQVNSNDTLRDMVVWPEELRTWIIGDGYFLNSRYDPNYLGSATDEGFYMGTDIGYLRFIFYFGIAGLIWIIAFIIYSTVICCKYFKDYTWLFVMALLVGLVVWAKVSTDVFLFFALFLCAAALQEPQESIQEGTSTTETP